MLLVAGEAKGVVLAALTLVEDPRAGRPAGTRSAGVTSAGRLTGVRMEPWKQLPGAQSHLCCGF